MDNIQVIRGNDLIMNGGAHEPLWLARMEGGITPWAHGRSPEEARANCIAREQNPPDWIVSEPH